MFEGCSSLADLSRTRIRLIQSGGDAAVINAAYNEARKLLAAPTHEVKVFTVFRNPEVHPLLQVALPFKDNASGILRRICVAREGVVVE